MPASSQLENATAVMSKGLAARISRRSFVAWTGRFAMVMATAGTLVGISAHDAFALVCSCAGRGCNAGCSGSRPPPSRCRSGHSVTCAALGSRTRCPTNTVACGSWVCSCSSCASGRKRWTDCCATGQCAATSSCHCVTDTDGVLRPTCCYKKCYAGGGSNCSHFIRCRFGACT
jgi:hypothetical protein